jgi:hypothetical protein
MLMQRCSNTDQHWYSPMRCLHVRERRLSHDDFAGWVTALNTALVRLEFTHYASRSSHQPKNGMVAARAEDLKMTQSDFGMAVIAALVAAGRQDVAEYESR